MEERFKGCMSLRQFVPVSLSKGSDLNSLDGGTWVYADLNHGYLHSPSQVRAFIVTIGATNEFRIQFYFTDNLDHIYGRLFIYGRWIESWVTLR